MPGERLDTVADEVWRVLKCGGTSPADRLTVLGCVCSGFLRVLDPRAVRLGCVIQLLTYRSRAAVWNAGIKVLPARRR